MEITTKCTRCRGISDTMLLWRNEQKNTLRYELGTFGDLDANLDCKTCQAIVEYFHAELEDNPPPSSCLYFGRLIHKQRFWIHLQFGDALDDGYQSGALELIPPYEMEPSTGYYLTLNEHWIDIQRTSRWPASCDLEHQGVCHTFPAWKTLDVPTNLILIDVETWSLVMVKPSQYVALSYVWGRIPDILETTKANFHSLQESGALTSSNLSARLPRTVRDAIILTKAVGQRYLWVDRLCIVQDDFANKKQQLDSMASIYARSYFTIVAADGPDADYGLRGVPGSDSPRSHKQKLYHFSNHCSMLQAPIPEEKQAIKDWHRRGWTFQERTLSNRNLVFFDDQVFWECRSSIWLEDLADIAEGANPLKISKRKAADGHDLQFFKWPDLHQYANLVQRYNCRLLSFPSDGLNAFSAVLQALSRSFPGGFLHGLPELFFDYSILWAPILSGNSRGLQFPSWSWLSHEGDIVFLYYNKCDGLLFESSIGGKLMLAPAAELYPMVDWYKISAETGERHRVGNSYYEYQRMRTDNDKPLPPGWSRYTHHQSHPRLKKHQEDIVYFKHMGIWGKQFIYPFPIAEEPLRNVSALWTNHLAFTATRRFLFLGPEMRGRAESGGYGWSNYHNAEVAGCIVFSLLDAFGNWVGLVRGNENNERNAPVRERCEIIVVSGGLVKEDAWDRARNGFMELDVRKELRGMEVYEFFNVLWVEWNGGVAYRRGVGRVWKLAWEKETAERVDVVLG